MPKRALRKPVEIEITLEQLQSFGRQLGIKPGPLSPILTADPGLPPEDISDPNLVSKRGEPFPHVVSAFHVLARPEIAAGLICIAPGTILDISIFSRYQNREEHSVALYKGQHGLWLHSPAPKKRVLAMLHESLNIEAPEEAPVSLDAVTFTGEGWVLWSMMDLLYPIGKNGQEETEDAFTTKQILEKMAAPVEGLWNLAAYYRDGLELTVPKAETANRWCADLTKQGFLERSDTKKWKASWLLKSVVRGMFPLRAHVHFKLAAQAPAGGLGSVRFWGLQGKSGNCLIWYAHPEQTQFLSASTGNLMDILQRMIEHPEFVFGPGEPPDAPAGSQKA
jgi:hypothetical protein